ncbi:MAG: flagellar export protein FliJ [Thalassotalea sp.]
MSLHQLNTLYKYEHDKEQKSAQQLQLAEQDYQQNLLRLQNVIDYRLEYMKRLDQRALEGIDSATYLHFHAFIAKLDNAAGQVEIAIAQAKALVEQRRNQWFAQQQKVKAVEHLQEKKITLKMAIENKREQAMFDELATQQFIRRRHSF